MLSRRIWRRSRARCIGRRTEIDNTIYRTEDFVRVHDDSSGDYIEVSLDRGDLDQVLVEMHHPESVGEPVRWLLIPPEMARQAAKAILRIVDSMNTPADRSTDDG